MNDYLHFDTAIICSNDFSDKTIADTFEFFCLKGFRKFIFLYDFDFDFRIYSDGLAVIKSIHQRLNLLKPHGIIVKCFFNFEYTHYLSNNPYLRRMNPPKRKLLFLSLPAFYEGLDINPTLNYLLYKQKYLPVFTSFEKNIMSCPIDYIDNFIFKKTAGVFAIDYNFLVYNSSDILRFVKKAVKEEIPILPCFSQGLHSYEGYTDFLMDFQNRHSSEFCIKLSRLFVRSFNLIK